MHALNEVKCQVTGSDSILTPLSLVRPGLFIYLMVSNTMGNVHREDRKRRWSDGIEEYWGFD